MKILFIHNDYIKPSGEEAASGELAYLLEEHGHEVRWYRKSSANIYGLVWKIKAFLFAFYNPKAARELSDILDDFKPDVVQVQNIYPFISTSIFKPLKERHIPVVMRCPNYRLFCPNGLCLDNNGKICEKCFGNGHEIWCVLKNCENSKIKSLGYALRGWFARKTKHILNGVDTFIVQSDFQKQKFVSQGIPAHKIAIVPGIAPDIEINDAKEIGEWVSFVGRVSAEKGIDEFILAAKKNPKIPFKVAGNIDASYCVPHNLPPNLEFVGFIKGKELNDFYLKSRIIVVPSKWYEGFPNVIVRGMLLGRPIITTDIGAMQSIIDNKKNGILVPPANSNALADAINELYNDITMCTMIGKSAKKTVADHYSREKIYTLLENIYKNIQTNLPYL